MESPGFCNDLAYSMNITGWSFWKCFCCWDKQDFVDLDNLTKQLKKKKTFFYSFCKLI